jgi:EAL domain-containing protein (putative c-di-GMP-specific phosphodiesterase class I)
MDSSRMCAVLGSGSIEVCFLPIVDLTAADSPVHSVECLCGGPRGSLVSTPAALLRLARELRIEGEVDQACLSAALREAALLPGAPRLHLTAHASTLAGEGFLAFLLGELEKSRIAPSRITLVLTEPDPVDTPALLVARGQLRDRGIAVGLDVDRRLQAAPHALIHLSPNVLELDGQLVRRAARHSLDAALLASVGRLARSVGARALAKGVETEGERDLALASGFTLAQGSLFGGGAPAVLH